MWMRMRWTVERSWVRRGENAKRKKGYEASKLKHPPEHPSVAPDTLCNEPHVCPQSLRVLCMRWVQCSLKDCLGEKIVRGGGTCHCRRLQVLKGVMFNLLLVLINVCISLFLPLSGCWYPTSLSVSPFLLSFSLSLFKDDLIWTFFSF